MAIQVNITSPGKLYFPSLGVSKRDVIAYYEAVSDAVLRQIRGRPIILKRYPNGIDSEFFYQKRAPSSRPNWVRTVTYRFPSGRSADEVVIDSLSALIWAVQIGNIELHAHPLREDDLEHPDELRIDLDPGPGVDFSDVRRVALEVRDVLDEQGLRGWPKTSGGRGLHVYARIERRWGFSDVRRAALAVAREVARRQPALATSQWRKHERHGVFLDYNQNARDRTMASAYSLRARQDARVSTPLAWHEVPTCNPAEFTIATVPERLATLGDPAAGIDDAAPGVLDSLLALADAQARDGERDAPWPPFHPKPRDESELRIVARAATEREAIEGLERWKKRHRKASKYLKPEDLLVDTMRGRYTTWTRIRVDLRNVPADLRPAPEDPDPDYDPASP